MKKRLIYTLSAIAFTIIFCSCFEDKTKYGVETPVVDIDPDGEIKNPIRVGYMEEFTVDPKVIIAGEVNPEDLTCKWEINTRVGGIDFSEIFEGRVLQTSIENKIASGYYSLLFTVIDNKTGNMAQKIWDVSITSFAAGIIVADTRDGATSDINLIMDKRFSEDYEGESIVRYSLNESITGSPLPSIIKSINSAILGATWSTYYNVIMTVLQDNMLLFYNTNEYSNELSFSTTINMNGVNQTIDVPLPLVNESIYPSLSSSDNPAYFIPGKQANFFINNEQLYFKISNSYQSVSYLTPDVITGGNHVDNSVISIARTTSDVSYSNGPEVIWYDNTAGKIFQWNQYGDKGVLTENTGFNPENIPNRRAKAGGVTTDGLHHALLLKNLSTGNYEIYLVRQAYSDWDYNSNNMVTKPIVDIPADLTTPIDASVNCVFSLLEPILYVVTGNQIIGVNFADPFNVIYSTKYTASSGETITAAIQYLQGGYYYDASAYGPPEWVENYGYKPILDFTANALLVGVETSQYEGKVLVIPQKNRGSGDLDTAGIITFTGFGRILDFTVAGS